MKQSEKHKKKSLLQKAMIQVFPMLLQEKTQSFMLIAFTLLALILFGLFAISPTIVTIVQLRKQLTDNLLVSNKLQQKLANLSILQQKYILLQPELPLVLAAIPDSQNITELIGQTQGLIQKDSVQLVSLQTDPFPITPLEKQCSFSVTIQGNKDHILAFISDFMSFERITTVKEVLLNAITMQKEATMQATITGIAYSKTL